MQEGSAYIYSLRHTKAAIPNSVVHPSTRLRPVAGSRWSVFNEVAFSPMSCVSAPSPISEHEIDSANLYHTPPMSNTPYSSVGGTPYSRMGGVIRPAQISSYRHTRMCRERGGSGFSWRSGAACFQRQTVPRAIVLSICLSEAMRGHYTSYPTHRPDRPASASAPGLALRLGKGKAPRHTVPSLALYGT